MVVGIQVLLAILLGIVVVGSFAGCDKSGEQKQSSLASTSSEKETGAQTGTQKGSQTETVPSVNNANENPSSVAMAASARAVLDACIAKYKGLKSYEDQGVLKVRYRVADKPFEKTEPMRVAYEVPNRLAMKSIGLQTSWTKLTWEAMFTNEQGSPFGNQRVVRPRPEKFDLAWLINDNLGNLLDNRVTGTPIQLNLLLEDKPLSDFLADPNVTLSVLKQESFDSAMCDRIQISRKNSAGGKDFKWTLWIDSKDKLLRKFELPVDLLSMLNPDLPPGLDPATSELSMELLGAKADAQVAWSNWDLSRSDKDLLVSRFVDAPLGNLPSQLGQVLKAFDLRDANKKIVLDSSQRSKPITVLCWVGNDELSENFVKYALEVYRELNNKGMTGYTEVMFVSKSPATEMQDAFKRWNCDLPLAIDTENLTESIFGMSRHPSIVVLDKQTMVQHIDEVGYLEQIPEIVASIQNGVNRAARTLQVQVDNQARFVSRLHRATIDRVQTDQLAPIEPFPMVYHELQRVWQTSLDSKVIAAGGEQFYPHAGSAWEAKDVFDAKSSALRVMTVLDETGDLIAVDNTGKKSLVARIPIEKANNAKRIHISVDPWTHRWVAIIPEGLPRYWLFEMPLDMRSLGTEFPKEPLEFSLDESESPSVFAWTVQGNKPSLTIATTTGKLLVLDPVRAKALKGQTNGVVAIVPTLNARGECVAWNAVEPNGLLNSIDNLPSDGEAATKGDAPDFSNKSLSFVPEPGQWTWGRNLSESLIVGLGKLPSGETGAVLHNNQFEPIFTHPLSVRPDQCRIVASSSLADGIFYWISTAPRRVLHLQTKNGALPDQMSLGRPILGVALLPEDKNLRMTLAVDNEVSCWRIVIPQLQPSQESVKPAPVGSSSGGATP
ncbi:MAG: hypothetical protein ABL921_31630, partial [Pirellula sp.]